MPAVPVVKVTEHPVPVLVNAKEGIVESYTTVIAAVSVTVN